MNTAELKIELINKITSVKEIRIIQEIQKILDFELDGNEYEITSNQRKRILYAQKDSSIAEEEANREIEEWLSEK